MALKATIFKADLQIADMDRHYYQEHSLTLARHPSETDERMMMRLLAFALYADERLAFGKGLSDEEEPDLWQKDLTGAIERWIEVGLPDEKRIRKASNRAQQVVLLTYGSRAAEVWRQQNASALARHKNLTVLHLPEAASLALAALSQRTMRLQCQIQDGQIWLGDEQTRLEVTPERWQG
ncbi:MAG: YaeQ family protein [Sterolibacterium sp.]|nr:YaeQ family protein [Sterolibacterium sp.]MBP9798799.1 YaeQ family protein [Sterolibacterium sp.]